MCARFSIIGDAVSIQQTFPRVELPVEAFSPRYNIAPSQPIAVIPNDGRNKLDFFIWGLIPSWAKDPKIGYKMINARGETLGEKPSFRAAYKRRRCLILADGFYEWIKMPGEKPKTPHFIHLKTKEAFAFAGLWETWWAPDGSELKTATIITTEPNPLISKLHNRMPVILKKEDHELWLSQEEKKPVDLQHLLTAYPENEMAYYPVSTLVNSPYNDVIDCITPA